MINRGISIPIVPVIARTKKEMRIEAMVPYFANGRVFFGPELTPQVESQLIQFPHGKLVDIIDCFAMHMKYQLKEKRMVKPVEQRHADSRLSLSQAEVRHGHQGRDAGQGQQLARGRHAQGHRPPLLQLQLEVVAGNTATKRLAARIDSLFRLSRGPSLIAAGRCVSQPPQTRCDDLQSSSKVVLSDRQCGGRRGASR